MFSDGDDDNSGNNSLTSCSQEQLLVPHHEDNKMEDKEDSASLYVPHAITNNNDVEDVAHHAGNEESLKQPIPHLYLVEEVAWQSIGTMLLRF
jgi:hypothetical protein